MLEQLKPPTTAAVYTKWMDNDQPDHYTSNILFWRWGNCCSFQWKHSLPEGRRTRVMGSLGDVVGDMSSLWWPISWLAKTEWMETGYRWSWRRRLAAGDRLAQCCLNIPCIAVFHHWRFDWKPCDGLYGWRNRKHKKVMEVNCKQCTGYFSRAALRGSWILNHDPQS